MEILLERVCVLVKAYPQASSKYKETVCCAGITQDGTLRRLYPIVYRQLEPAQRFDRFDWIEANMNRAPGDPRPESFRVDQGTLRIIRAGKRASPESKAEIWLPHVAPSLTWLYDAQAKTGQSLGIVCPDPGTLQFRWKPISSAGKEEKIILHNASLQMTLFEEASINPLPNPEYTFRYDFESDGKQHAMTIHDWEVQATYANYKKSYGGPEAALEKMAEYYEQRILTMNPHFFVGNMQKRPNQFILIGVLRSTAIEGIDCQQRLF